MNPGAYKQITKALSRVLRTPPYLIVFVSDSCWMKCRHCWFNEQWKEDQLTHSALTFDEYSRMADSIDRVIFLSLTGGEAFQRQDLVELVTMFARKTRLSRYQIPTSGFRPDMIVSTAERLLQANPSIPFRVDVSMDGTEDVHETIRGVSGGYKRLVETVRGLNELREHYPNLDVGIITTLSTYNQDCIEDIAATAERINPRGEWLFNVVRGVSRDPRASGVDPRVYRQVHELIQRKIETGHWSGHQGHLTAGWLSAKNATRRKIIAQTLEGTYDGGGCAAGALAGVIYSDGMVAPCETLNANFGNIREYACNLARIWNSPRADEARNRIQEMRCHCTHECFLSVSMLIQPQRWPDIVRERIRLARGKSRTSSNSPALPVAPAAAAVQKAKP